MAELEKVIYSIERCICHVPDACRDCAYDAGHPYNECVELLFKDALSLLKAQEPRVMQFTEAMDAEVAWLEKCGENEIKPVIILGYEYGYWECLIYNENDAEITLTIDGFNTDWRCWTARPTGEQREKVKWV